MHQIFFTACQHIQNLHFAKKMVQIDQSSPQQWSEYFTAAYMGLPPPTRWSTQRANGQYKDHLIGQLTRCYVPTWDTCKDAYQWDDDPWSLLWQLALRKRSHRRQLSWPRRSSSPSRRWGAMRLCWPWTSLRPLPYPGPSGWSVAPGKTKIIWLSLFKSPRLQTEIQCSWRMLQRIFQPWQILPEAWVGR